MGGFFYEGVDISDIDNVTEGAYNFDLDEKLLRHFRDGKTIPYKEYDNIFQSSVHNVGKEKIMLGKFDTTQ